MSSPTPQSDQCRQPSWLIGDVLWGRISGHPWWPCMVAYDVATSTFMRERKGTMNALSLVCIWQLSWGDAAVVFDASVLSAYCIQYIINWLSGSILLVQYWWLNPVDSAVKLIVVGSLLMLTDKTWGAGNVVETVCHAVTGHSRGC